MKIIPTVQMATLCRCLLLIWEVFFKLEVLSLYVNALLLKFSFHVTLRMADLTRFHMLQVLMNVLSTRGVLEQGACLDALISIMLDSSANQMVDIAPSLCFKFGTLVYHLMTWSYEY